MKVSPAKALVASFLLAGMPVLADEAANQALITQLGSESYAEREKASLELWKTGDTALEALQKAADGGDPEVAKRAKDLIRKIDLGILPDSSPAIIELVTNYDKSGPAQRASILVALRRLKAYRQILKLYGMEKDEETLPSLSNAVDGVAILAARDCLAADPPNPEQALAYLKMGRPGPPEVMAAASISRSMGTLEKETKLAAEDTSPEGPIRRYALAVMSGRLDEAAAAAEAAGLVPASWRMRLLQGDPVPWIMAAGTGEDDYVSEGLNDYRDWLLKVWKTGVADLKYEPHFLALANSSDDEKAAAGVNFLFLTGSYAAGEKVLLKSKPFEAFSYFETDERLDEALSALKLDPANPDFKAWAAPRFASLIDKPEEADTEDRESELLEVAAFLNQHGRIQDLRDAYVPHLEKMLATNEDQFLQVASRLFSAASDNDQDRVIGPVFELIPRYAKEDDARWQDVMQELFGHDSVAGPLWAWLGQLDPALSREQRLEETAVLLGFVPDSKQIVKPFLAKAFEAYEKANAADQVTQLNMISSISTRSGDPHDYYKVVEIAMGREKMGMNLPRLQRLYLQWMGDWKKAAELWQEEVKKNPSDPINRAYFSAALNRTGDIAGAAREEAMASRLAMADFGSEYNCAEAFNLAGDFERGSQWLRQAVIDCSPDNPSGAPLVSILLEDSMEKGDWKLASAISEAMTFQQAMQNSSSMSPSNCLHLRATADMARAFARIKDDREGSIAVLEKVWRSRIGAASLADYFFPGLRAAGLTELHDKWFDETWQSCQHLVAAYPDADNMLNSIAWTCARANRRLDEAEHLLNHALELRTNQPAYLDSMGEIYFARRNREKAMEWSKKANIYNLNEFPRRYLADIFKASLLQQYTRFEKGEFPLP